ncbi:MAG: hypothetical protein Q8928_17885 [Bacteroidota bacterium]|nr:hypothetical protein [Bacteroidota bacterium]
MILGVSMLFSCGKKHKDRVIIAKVLDKYLYLSDIKHIFPEKVTKKDSIALAQAFITSWIKNQLLVNQAENKLTPEQLDINEQIENYRSSLLIYKYEEQLIKEQHDTLVSDADIEQYFKQNAASLTLDENYVKARYIVIPKTAKDISNVRKWYRSENSDDIKKLENYCYTFATKYDTFKDEWVSFEAIQKLLPRNIENEDVFLQSNKSIEQEDNASFYFVYIKDKNLKGSASPLSFVKTKIREIIINKRKIKFLSDHETKIYNDAQDHNKFVIYNLEKKSK